MNAVFTMSTFFATTFALSRVAAGSCGYSVEIFAGPDCSILPSFAHATGIADNGAMCGSYVDCAEVGHHVIWWADGNLTELPPSKDGGVPDLPLEVNSKGQVAGQMYVDSLNTPYRAFLYSEGSTSNLGALPTQDWAYASSISSTGIVVGASNDTGKGPLSAFVWQNGKMSPLPLTYGRSSEAFDISDSSKICGRMGNHSSLDSHAFVHDLVTGTTADLGVLLKGATASHATGISATGSVCGVSRIFAIPAWRGFIWNSGTVQDLGILPGKTHTRPQAINDSNVIVGYCDPGATAFVWRNGTMTALNDLIPPELNLNFRLAWDINNAGQIVGEASINGTSDRVAVRLTPIPSPTGDFNCDSNIDVDDLLGVINHWADTPSKGSKVLPPADFNHDAVVGIEDLLIVIDNWTV